MVCLQETRNPAVAKDKLVSGLFLSLSSRHNRKRTTTVLCESSFAILQLPSFVFRRL
jgi:hypothetical protein